jgi:hypothetical protein
MHSFDKWNAGKYLRASDYNAGDRFDVVIAAVRAEELRQEDGFEEKLIFSLNYRADGKRWGDFVPNLTARWALARANRDPEALIGLQILVVVVNTGFEGRLGFQVVVPAVQQPAPPSSPASPASPPPRPEPPLANTRPGGKHRKDKGNSPPAPATAKNSLDDDEIPF